MPKKTQNPLRNLTLLDMLRLTPAEIKDRAKRYCRIARKKYYTGSREGFKRSRVKHRTWYNEQWTVTVCRDPKNPRKKIKKHNNYIRFFGPPNANSAAWVWCDCEYFTYYLEVALTKYNASIVEKSNGKPPRVRNPQQTPYLCKHLVLAAREALKQSTDPAADKVAQEL